MEQEDVILGLSILCGVCLLCLLMSYLFGLFGGKTEQPKCSNDTQCQSNTIKGEFCQNEKCTSPSEIGFIDGKAYIDADRKHGDVIGESIKNVNALGCKQKCIDNNDCGGVAFIPAANDCYLTKKSTVNDYWINSGTGHWGWKK